MTQDLNNFDAAPQPREKLIVLLIAAIQFINILEFMIVMPLGPDFALALDIPLHNLGIIAGSYTLAGAVTGIIGSFFLDRFDRRKALAVTMLGLVCGTALGGFAFNLESLLAARIVAGAFGGPATSLALAVISDVIPVKRRGRAMATVMTAFAVASIFGVPLALELSHSFNWRMPFFAVALMGVVVSAGALWFLPPMKHHFAAVASHAKTPIWVSFTQPLPLLAFSGMACMMISAFLLIPHIPGYLVFNLHYKGEPWLVDWLGYAGIDYRPSALGPLYLFGGVASLLIMQLVGRWTDRVGSSAISWAGAVTMIAVVYFGFIEYQPWLPIMALFIGFMASGSLRGVPSRTLDTRIPRAHERAGFMSAQSAVQHVTLALAAIASSFMLSERPDKSLVGMELVGWLSIAFALILPLCVMAIERSLKTRDAQVTN